LNWNGSGEEVFKEMQLGEPIKRANGRRDWAVKIVMTEVE